MTDEPVADNKIAALRADQPVMVDGDRQLLETVAQFMPKPDKGKTIGFVMVTFYEEGYGEFWHFHDDDDGAMAHRVAFAGALLTNRAVIGPGGCACGG